MTKKEWKTRYSAARLLYRSLFSHCVNAGLGYQKREAFKLAVDKAWDFMYETPGVRAALDPQLNPIFSPTARWQMAYNTTAFERRMPIRPSKLKWRMTK